MLAHSLRVPKRTLVRALTGAFENAGAFSAGPETWLNLADLRMLAHSLRVPDLADLLVGPCSRTLVRALTGAFENAGAFSAGPETWLICSVGPCSRKNASARPDGRV